MYALPIWEVNCSRLRVKCPPQDFLDTGPVFIPLQQILEAHRVIFLVRKG